MLGKNIWEAFPQAVGSTSHQEMLRAAEEGQTVHFEAVSPVLGRWVEVSVYPNPAGLSVYFRDISERKRPERALTLYQQIFAHANDAIAVAD